MNADFVPSDETVVPDATKSDMKRKAWQDYTWPAGKGSAAETCRIWIRRCLAAEKALSKANLK